MIVALCLLVLFVVWNGVATGARWAWWAIAVTLAPLQVFGFVSDRFFGDQNVVANAVSALVLLAGLTLTYRPTHPQRAAR